MRFPHESTVSVGPSLFPRVMPVPPEILNVRLCRLWCGCIRSKSRSSGLLSAFVFGRMTL
jgi:hypothetical protein